MKYQELNYRGSDATKLFGITKKIETRTSGNRSSKAIFIATLYCVFLIAFMAKTNAQLIIDSGPCGDGLTWEMSVLNNDTTLTIRYDGVGTGVMDDYPLYDVPWDSQRENLKTLVMENGITHIGENAFMNCTGFTGSLIIPNSVTTIGQSAFEYCIGFTGSLTIPNSVTTIGHVAFLWCKGFTGSLTIGNSVTLIGIQAFGCCANFTQIISLRATPPTLTGNYLFNYMPSTIPVYVPCGSVSNYQSAWSDAIKPGGGFTNYICGYKLIVLSNNDALGSVTNYGIAPHNAPTLYAVPAANCVFTGWSDGNTDNPRVVILTRDSTFTANFAPNPLIDTVTSYKLRVTSLENDLSDCQGQVSGLESDTTALNLQIAGLQSDLIDCEADRDNLQALLDACQASLDSCLNGLSTKSLQSPPMLKIYPNPIQSNGVLHIEGESLQSGDKIEIYDMQGKLISVNFATGKETSINIGTLSQGTYLLRLAGKRGVRFNVSD